MFGKKKTLEQIREELEVQLLRDGVPKEYESLADHATDNEYLYYILHGIGRSNRLLRNIKDLLQMILVLIVLYALIFGWFGLK